MEIPGVIVSDDDPRNEGKERMQKQSAIERVLEFVRTTVGQANGKEMKQEPAMLSNLDTMMNVLILIGLNVVGGTILKNVLEVGNIFRLPSFLRNQLSGQGSSVVKLMLFFLSYIPYNLIALKIERLMLKKQMSESLGLICYHIILTVLLSVPVIFCVPNDMHSVLRGVIAATTCYTFLKLISYYQVNSQQRSAYFRKECETKKEDKEQSAADSLSYPDNLTVKNSLYYTYLPTFCYKISFPKRNKFELRVIAREVLEALFQFEIIANIYEHIWPIAHNHFNEDWGLTNFSNLHHVILHFRYVAVIAVPVTLAAILLNYALFFKVLKVIGELLRYDCGSFCGPWWRMTTVKDYWANWNYAVQNWMRDHLYKPLRKKGVHQVLGLYAVFIVSGVLHDYVIGVALACNTGLLLTICFVSSVPYVIFSPIVNKYLEPYGRHLGNISIIGMWYYSTVFGFSCMYKIKYAQ